MRSTIIRLHQTKSAKDLGVATALLTRFTTQRLPRALALKEKVERGERLDEGDIAFLHEVFETAIKPLVDRHPEYQEIYAQAAQLYKEITEKALDNEIRTTWKVMVQHYFVAALIPLVASSCDADLHCMLCSLSSGTFAMPKNGGGKHYGRNWPQRR